MTAARSLPRLGRWLDETGVESVLATLESFAAPAAVYLLDRDGCILYWSPGAEAMFGFSPGEALGRLAQDILVCRQCGGLAVLADKGHLENEPVEVVRADGSCLSATRSARALRGADGSLIGVIGLLRPAAEGEGENSGGTPRVETFHGLVTRDLAMQQALQIVRNVAGTEASILIRGESGTGKELIARALHEESPRRRGPFLAVNCAALNPNLLESELFGHVRGAFTGAHRDHAGLFHRADGGTLFLDEVAELPLELQAKLLRALQERVFVPVGGERARAVDVRIVAATHCSLREAVKAGRFREDLMYRLRVVPIFVPPLRARPADVELLLRREIDRHNRQGPRRIRAIAPAALRKLLDHPWPGNVRELQNVVEYAFAVGRGETLRAEDLPPEFREQPPALLPVELSAVPSDEAGRIREALRRAGGRIDEAARLLEVSRATFWRMRKKHGV